MTPKPTLDELQDETRLRQVIAKALHPKGLPYYCDEGAKAFDGYSVGSGKCERCGRDYHSWQECDVWYPDDRPMPVLVHELVKKCKEQDLVSQLIWRIEIETENGRTIEHWLRFTPTNQAICCLLTLGEAVVTKEGQKP